MRIGYRIDMGSPALEVLNKLSKINLQPINKDVAKQGQFLIKESYPTRWGRMASSETEAKPYNAYTAIKHAVGISMKGFFTGSTYDAITGESQEDGARVSLKGHWPFSGFVKTELDQAELLASFGYNVRWAQNMMTKVTPGISDADASDIVSNAFRRRFGGSAVLVTIDSGGIDIKWPENAPAAFSDRVYPGKDFDSKQYLEHPSARPYKAKSFGGYFMSLDEAQQDNLTQVVGWYIGKIIGIEAPYPMSSTPETAPSTKRPPSKIGYGTGEPVVSRTKVFGSKLPKSVKGREQELGVKKYLPKAFKRLSRGDVWERERIEKLAKTEAEQLKKIRRVYSEFNALKKAFGEDVARQIMRKRYGGNLFG